MRRLWIVGGASTGKKGLQVKSRRNHSYHRTPQSTIELILHLRRERRWGPNRIEGYLHNYAGSEITPISHRTIHKILIQAGLNNPIPKPRRIWGKRRFQRPHSNSLWQADFKLTEQDEWMISYLDDHSRFIPGSRIHHNPTAEHAIKLLRHIIEGHRRSSHRGSCQSAIHSDRFFTRTSSGDQLKFHQTENGTRQKQCGT